MAKFSVTYPYYSQRSFVVEAKDEEEAFNKVWGMDQTQDDNPDADDIRIRKASKPLGELK